MADNRFLTLFLAVIISCIACVITSFIDYKYDDTNIVFLFLAGVFVTAIYSFLLAIILMFLLAVIGLIGYWLIGAIIIIIYHWINPDRNFYLRDSKLVVFVMNLIRLSLDFEEPGYRIMFYRLLFIFGYYWLFYHLYGSHIYGVM